MSTTFLVIQFSKDFNIKLIDLGKIVNGFVKYCYLEIIYSFSTSFIPNFLGTLFHKIMLYLKVQNGKEGINLLICQVSLLI